MSVEHPAGDAITGLGRVSIVVLTHNRCHLLRQCVDNVLLRTSGRTGEIVIWNNASTDGTAAYLDTLIDSRIRVVHHPTNIGVNAYARLFPQTTGDYLIEVDDDVIDAPPASSKPSRSCRASAISQRTSCTIRTTSPRA